MRTGTRTFSVIATILVMTVGCAEPEDPAMRPFRMNPFPVSSPKAEQIKFPPGGGTSVYWLDGRFNVTLNNFNDESIEGEKAIFVETICFRQDGQCVSAINKAGQLMVLNLSTSTFKKDRDIHAFAPQEQLILVKLTSKTRGNIHFDPITLMPDL
jgi:hypothetical protein